MKNKLTQRTLSWLLSFAILILQTGCFYQQTTINYNKSSKTDFKKIKTLYPNFYFIHKEQKIVQLTNVSYDPETDMITGDETLLSDKAMQAYEIASQKNIAVRGNRVSAKDIEQVHFYVSDFSSNADGKVSFKKSDLLETKLVSNMTALNGLVLISIGGMLAAGAFAGFIAFLVYACNCPHVYVNNGQEYVRTSNAFVGSVSKTLEQSDYAKVPLAKNTELKVDIINEEDQEDQYVNQVKLLEIVHDPELTIMPDQQGNIYAIRTPLQAQNNEEVRVADDGLSYDFSETESKNDLYELTLDFDREVNQDQAKLVLALKNTYWASYVMKEWYGLFGSEIDAIKEKNANRTAEAQLNWQKEQGITLSVFVKKEGKWVFQDDVNVVGNTIYRDLVVPVDLSGIESETASVRLVAGFKLWELDYAGLDYSLDVPMEINELSASTVLKNSEVQPTLNVNGDDEQYEHLASNDTLSLAFTSTQEEQEQAVSYVLKTKGYYIKHSNQSGPMAKRELMSFRRKGQMSRYSRYLMENIFSEMAIKE